MAKIVPIDIPLVGKVTDICVKILTHSAEDSKCVLFYELSTDTGLIFKEDNYAMTEEEFAEWGADNSYLLSLVVSKLDGIDLLPLDNGNS